MTFFKRTLTAFLAAAFLFSFSGCALIFSGTSTKVSVPDGIPAGAKVYYNGAYVGTTPCKVKVSKKDLQKGQAVITIKADGYKDANITVSGKIKVGAIIGDVLLGIFPLIIDFVTGAIYKPQHDTIKYSLEKAYDSTGKEVIEAINFEFPQAKARVTDDGEFVTVAVY